MARTLANVETDLAAARAALDSATRAVSYQQGDRQVTRAPLIGLRQEVERLEREKREVTAAAAGANNPAVLTPKW